MPKYDEFERGLRELVVEGMGDGSIVPCNPKLAIFMVMGALNWSRKWYRPNGNWSGPQIATALTQMFERSLSSTPVAALIEDPTVTEFDELAEELDDEVRLPKARRRPA